MIETLDARPGEKILDIGCGTGSMSFNLSKKVGQSGLVCGYDISQPMLESLLLSIISELLDLLNTNTSELSAMTELSPI